MSQIKPYSPLNFGLIVALLAAGLDQTSKWAVVHFFALPLGQPHFVLPFWDMTFIWNRGVSYGLLDTASDMGRWLLVGLTISIIGLLIWWLHKAQNRTEQLAFGLIIGGALGNLVDRILYGAVVDFISLHMAGYYWYVFNIADIWISFGVVMLLVVGFIDARRTRAYK